MWLLESIQVTVASDFLSSCEVHGMFTISPSVNPVKLDDEMISCLSILTEKKSDIKVYNEFNVVHTINTNIF